MMTHRVRIAGWAVLLMAMLPAIWFFRSQRDVPHFGFLLDDAIYHSSAKSLASGEGYRIESLPGTPVQTKYPPGYPVLLAPIWRFGGEFPNHLGWALALNALAFAIYCLLLLPRLFRDLGIDSPWDLVLAAAVALNPPTIFYAASLMSETVAGLIFAAMLLAASRWPLAGGLLAGASMLMRSASIVLLGAGPLWFLLRRQWRSALIWLAASLPFALAWNLWSGAHRVDGGTPQLRYYVDYFGYLLSSFELSELQTVIGANFGTLVTCTGSLLWFEPSDSLAATYGKTVLTLLAVAGLVKMIQARGVSLYALFAIAYVAVLLPWNFSPNERFLLPLLPLLVAGLYTAVRGMAGAMAGLWRKSGIANRTFAGLLLTGLAIGGLCWIQAQTSATSAYFPALFQRERDRRVSEAPALAWVRANLPPDASAVAYQESRFYLFTGRRAIGMPLPSKLGYRGDRAAILAYFRDPAAVARANGARYLYVTPWDYELDLGDKERAARLDALRTSPAWRATWSNSGFAVFELLDAAHADQQVTQRQVDDGREHH